MKKNFVKSLALVMCVIITCLSVSVGSFAASGNVYNVSELKGYEISSVTTNDSETIALVSLDSGEKYAVTKNGKDYTILNFDKYLPKGSEWIEVFDFTQKDDTFVFLLRAYKTEVVQDKIYGEYEKITLTSQIILTTTDFSAFKKHTVNINLDNVSVLDVEYGAIYKNEYANLIFCEKTFVLAADFIEVTKTDKNGRYIKGVYYTTTDYVNWTKRYTPEFYQEKNAWGYSETVIEYSCIQNYKMLIKYYYGDFSHIMYQEGVFVVSDFSQSVSLASVEGAYYSNIKRVYAIPNTDLIIKVVDVYSRNGDDIKYSHSKVELFNYKNKKTTELLNKKGVSWFCLNNGTSFYFITEKSGSKAETYVFNKNTNKLESASVSLGYKITNNFKNFGLSKDCIYFFYANDKLCVSTSGSPFEYNEYDISSYGFDESYIKVFCLNDKVFIIGNIWDEDGKVKVAETNISLQKKGDIDSNGKINSTDALVILQSAVGKVTLSKEQKSIADVNKDGKINSTDALMILQFTVGLLEKI